MVKLEAPPRFHQVEVERLELRGVRPPRCSFKIYSKFYPSLVSDPIKGKIQFDWLNWFNRFKGKIDIPGVCKGKNGKIDGLWLGLRHFRVRGCGTRLLFILMRVMRQLFSRKELL